MFYIEKDNKIVLFDESLQRLQNTLLYMPQYKGLEIKETDRIISNFQFTDTEEYIKKQEVKERERINGLKITKRVFALILKQYGITYNNLKQVIASNEDAQLEWDLCIELERSNSLLDIMASQEPFNLSSEDLDNIFKYANGELEELPERV